MVYGAHSCAIIRLFLLQSRFYCRGAGYCDGRGARGVRSVRDVRDDGGHDDGHDFNDE